MTEARKLIINAQESLERELEETIRNHITDLVVAQNLMYSGVGEVTYLGETTTELVKANAVSIVLLSVDKINQTLKKGEKS